MSFMKTKLLFVLALTPMLAGCNTTQHVEKPVTITDGLGRSVTYDANKTSRFICVGAGALRYYSYVADMNKIVGVEQIDGANTFGIGTVLRPYYEANKDYLSTLENFGRGGPDAQKLDEALMTNIIKAKPHVVFSFLSTAEMNDELQSKTNIPVIALKQGPDAIFDAKTQASLELIASVTGNMNKYNSLKNFIDTCKSDFDNLEMTTESYYVAGVGNWGQVDFYGSFNKFPVFKYAKVKNALEDIDLPTQNPGQVTIDKEKLVSANPDKVFVDTALLNNFVGQYKSDTEFKTVIDSMDAFKNKETYQLLPYAAYFINLEIQLMSTYYVASVAHPEAFQNFDLEAKCNEITLNFNGKAMYETLKNHTFGCGGYQKFDLQQLIK